MKNSFPSCDAGTARLWRVCLLSVVVFTGFAGLASAGDTQPAGNRAVSGQQTAWVVADFDGDDKADLVTLDLAALGLSRDPQFPGHPNQPGSCRRTPGAQPAELSVQFNWIDPSALSIYTGFPTERLLARDLDGDSDRDIVLETTSSVAIAIWINDGTGHFERGNLDDFRYQLSQDDSHCFDLQSIPQRAELTDECPRNHVVSRPGSFGWQPCFSNLAASEETVAPTARFAHLRSRGPPARS